ncbi:MAG: 16S rRNA (cytosine(1402)-N(4))-methyltransferase RsmH [Gammaproteobacteria bacterium]|nr:16S rRNA (cytosine(1402)-N(4))-methyltransferase RsmH [Gammaproteobacteria bacterium]
MNAHYSVMLSEVLLGLNMRPDGIYVDATFGRGGHSRAILSALGSHGSLYALDQDLTAVEYAKEHFNDPRFHIAHVNFADLKTCLESFGIYGKVSGILMDLGVSSPQLDDAGRGFSFMRQGPLDMRMNTTLGMTAADYVNRSSAEEMEKIFFEFGEERFSRRIASAIVAARATKPFETTQELVDVIAGAQPRRDPNKHPATRVFQALRIEVNQELEVLKQALKDAENALEQHGRLAVISFHSLEDRIVKRFLEKSEKGPELPPHLPIPAHLQYQSKLKRIGRAIKPGERELAENPRSRSAILRIGEKIS